MLVVSRRLQYRHIHQEFLANKVLLMNVHITRRFLFIKYELGNVLCPLAIVLAVVLRFGIFKLLLILY
jgi:hypothetical protein